jgi:hypothetical protein
MSGWIWALAVSVYTLWKAMMLWPDDTHDERALDPAFWSPVPTWVLG